MHFETLKVEMESLDFNENDLYLLISGMSANV